MSNPSSDRVGARKRSFVGYEIAVALVIVLVALWSAVVWDARRTEEQALEHARRETATLALLFAEQAEATFRSVDLALTILREAWVQSPRAFEREVERHAALLKGVAVQLVMVDAKGFIAFSTLGPPLKPVHVGDREQIAVHFNRAADALHVGRPVRGAYSGKWSIPLTRPIIDKGKVAGVISIAIDPDYFVRFYRNAGLGDDGAARMLRDTGEVMARSSGQEKYVGKVLDTSRYTAPGAAISGSFRGRAQVDGIERLSSWYRLPERGVTVVVGPSVQEWLAPVRAQQSKSVIGATLASVLMTLIALQLIRTIVKEHAWQRELEAREARLALATTNNGVGVWDLDLGTRELVWDDSMFTLCGLQRGDFGSAEQAWARVAHPDDRERVERALADALAEGGRLECEFRIRRPGGEIRHLRCSAKLIRDPGGRPSRLVGADVDVTEAKLAQEARRVAEEQARRLVESHRDELEARVAERTRELVRANEAAEAANVAKSRFLANVSHELRTPLNQITGMTYLVRRDPVTPNQVSRLDRIDASVQSLTRQIDSVLEMARIESGAIEVEQGRVDIAWLLEDAAAGVRARLATKDVAVAVQTDAHVLGLGLLGDNRLLKAALQRYVDNAARHTERGSVTVSARVLEESALEATVIFEVADTGDGIEPDVLARLFSNFVQADDSLQREHGGNGLGLAMTRKLAMAMGGDAGCSSVPREGSRFWFTARLRKAAAGMPA